MTETIYFYGKDETYGQFSNFASFGIEMDEVWWPTVEHYFQAQKFNDAAYRDRIAKASTPKQAKVLGLSRDYPLRDDWDAIKDEIMLVAVRKKFATHATLRKLLLSTGNARLAEAAPSDYYWGVGGDGSGLNKLGLILEAVRSELSA